MKDQANDRRSPIIWIALVTTAVLLFVFGWLLSGTDTCPEGWWFWHRLNCLEPNELGDTFAGAFAPVAFVWLVAAVLLQRNELAAQRQELRESRAVAAQQVEEARRNVSFIEAQTTLLEEGRRLEDTRANDAQFLEMVDIFNRSFRWCDGKFEIWQIGETKAAMRKSREALAITHSVEIDWVEQAKKNIEALSYLNFSIVVLGMKHDRFEYKGLGHLERAIELLGGLDNKHHGLSEPMQAKAVYMAIDTSYKEALEILEVLKAQGSSASLMEDLDD
ncbi:hypothetical protein [Pelagibacterium sp.]|uniref:hypothetical protein n=1 Tax=Pelagibacterium sp. TaxID=1967288 RepID=UPI003A929976